MSGRHRKPNAPENTNPHVPDTPPTPTRSEWHQKSLNDLQVSVGKIETTLSHLVEKLDDFKADNSSLIDELKADNKSLMDRLNKVETKLIVASAVLGVLLTVGTVVGSVAAYVGNKAIDFGIDMAKEKIKADTQPTATKPSK